MPARMRVGPLPPTRRKRPPRRPPAKRPPRPKKPDLHIAEILAWADTHHRRTGRWPNGNMGEVQDAPWDTWQAIDRALRHGFRGCRGGSSLGRLLQRHRGAAFRAQSRTPLTVRQILAWADAHHRRTGRWPSSRRRPVVDAPGETWLAVGAALMQGTRGLPGGDSLAKLLLRRRGVRRTMYRTPLTLRQILAWADAHFRRHGHWPKCNSGRVAGTRDETWMGMHAALRTSKRGLPSGYTLATLLEKHRGRPHKGHRRRFTEQQIVAWADAYQRRTGRWPNGQSGPIPESPGDTWRTVQVALWKGYRGLPGRSTLFGLFARHGRVPAEDWRLRRMHLSQQWLTVPQILAWADEYHRRHLRWPTCEAGRIAGTHDATWGSVDYALRVGTHGLRGGLSLATLLEKRRGLRHKGRLPRFTERGILAWADAHHRRSGRWPTLTSGPIPQSPGDTWRKVENALSRGCRGLPGRDTLFRFLVRHDRIPSSDPRVQRLQKATAASLRKQLANLRLGPLARREQTTESMRRKNRPVRASGDAAV